MVNSEAHHVKIEDAKEGEAYLVYGITNAEVGGLGEGYSWNVCEKEDNPKKDWSWDTKKGPYWVVPASAYYTVVIEDVQKAVPLGVFERTLNGF